jgi:adenine-specific DNA-methyltransferase
MTQEQIHQLFKHGYNQSAWKQFLGETFTNSRLLTSPETLTGIDSNVASKAVKLGYIALDEEGIERQIAVYEVTLAKGIILERNRVGLRNLLRKYWKDIDASFIVYHSPENNKWRFTYVSELTGYDASGEFIKIKTEPKRYTYLLGEGESTRTAAERFALITKKASKAALDDVKDAFSVEKLSKVFFDEYKEQYDIFCEFMMKKPNIRQAIFNGDEKAIRDFNKKLLGRIVFLYFIQKKGWMGVPVSSKWGQGDFDFLTNLFDQQKNPDLFYSETLSKLFFDTLNTKRNNDIIELIKGQPCRIPYLNGGLFEEDDKKHRNIILNAKLFENLFNFFNQYNFTIYEDDPNDHTVAVDPEMLGHIFENLLEDNKDKGAFYTPKEIVHYMCQESLIEYLTAYFEGKGYEITGYTTLDKPQEPRMFSVNEGRIGQMLIETNSKKQGKQIDRSLIEKLLNKKLDDSDKKLVKQHSVEFHHALDTVKIADPAIGSGAFPMGLLQEIFIAKQTLYHFQHGNLINFPASDVKLNIIQNSIYGVDIEKGAVDIARLRFWLSLVVDEEEPKALPNLDYKIVVGNSLVSKLGDDIIEIDWTLNETSHGLFGADLAKQKAELLKKISKEQKDFFNPNSDKKTLAADIRKLKIDLLITQLELMTTTKGLEKKPSGTSKALSKQTELYLQTIGWKASIKNLQKLKTKPDQPLQFFDWKLDFPEVMNESVTANNGFDIVIGNPPYISAVTMARSEETKKYFKDKYPLATGSYDLYLLFLLKAIELANSKGIYTWIIPNKFLIADYAKKVKSEFLSSNGLQYSINVSKFNVFEGIGVYPIIIFGRKNSSLEFAELMLEKYDDLEKRIFKLPTELKAHKTFKDFGIKINSGATGFQAQQLKEVISNRQDRGSIPFAVSGNIDRYSWSNESVRYMGEKYSTAFINNRTSIVAKSKWKFWSNPKIVIAGMTKVIEAVYVESPLGMGVGIYGIYDFGGIEPHCLTAILNSKYLTYYFTIKFKDKHLAGGYLAINKSTIEEFPLVAVSKQTQKRLSILSTHIHELVDNGKSIDKYEREIDQIVYRLYNLSFDEVKKIDPEFPLSKKEFEAIKLD